MIWTIKVVLYEAFYDDISWEALIEIDSSSKLDDLHLAIQKFVNFGDDHPYEFYQSRDVRSKRRVRYTENENSVYETTLKMLYPLNKGNGLFYLFDYGDQWIFKITKSRKKALEPKDKIKYPILVGEKGSKPIQYQGIED
ncbi:MAG: plasmid pRiA4b ORF-3 family protein [Desulfobulbaceae bacterium]|nr:plasmid pRiA4b ORF-3 family protein [Desulfobulbaceae bacterium]